MRSVVICVLIVAVLVGGCTGLQKSPPARDWDQRRAALLTLQDWSLRGRVAIKAAAGGGQASLDWSQRGPRSQLSLAGPFGAGRVQLTVAPERITLSDKSGEQVFAYEGVDAAERFMLEQLGWFFPVQSARYWVLGLLDPDIPGEQYFTAGELESLQQSGWTVVYDRFDEFNGQYLPAKLMIADPQMQLKMVIRNWSPDYGLTQ